MTTKQFIEKAIDGGYNGYPKPFCMECGGYQTPNGQTSMFLDPEAWKAVGRMEEWDGLDGFRINGNRAFYMHGRDWPGWKTAMHCLIDALAEGKTIEQYLASLSPSLPESGITK